MAENTSTPTEISSTELGAQLQLTDRELKEIHHCIYYAGHLGAYGTAGHNQLVLIARLAWAQGFDVAAGHLRYNGLAVIFPNSEAQG